MNLLVLLLIYVIYLFGNIEVLLLIKNFFADKKAFNNAVFKVL